VRPGLDLSIRYLNLGNPRLRMKTTTSGSQEPAKYSFKMETAMLLFQVGWRFQI
jgi:hypothetical protein